MEIKYKDLKLQDVFREIYNVLRYMVDQQNLVNIRFDMLGNMYGGNNEFEIIVNLDPAVKIKNRLEGPNLRSGQINLKPRPVFSEGFNKQSFIIKKKYVNMISELFPSAFTYGSKLYSFPTPLDAAEIIDVEQTLMRTRNVPDEMNPMYSPCVNVNLGPNYFCIYSMHEIVRDKNDFLSKFQRYIPEITHIIRLKSLDDPWGLTKKQIERLVEIYNKIGVYIQIREYK